MSVPAAFRPATDCHTGLGESENSEDHRKFSPNQDPAKEGDPVTDYAGTRSQAELRSNAQPCSHKSWGYMQVVNHFLTLAFLHNNVTSVAIPTISTKSPGITNQSCPGRACFILTVGD